MAINARMGCIAGQAGGLTPDSNRKFLNHWNGIDAATASADSALGGNAPHTVTFNGTAQLDTAQKKLGSASLLTDGGATSHVTLADDTDWSFGAGDATVEMFIRRAALGREVITGQMDSGGTVASASFYIEANTSNKAFVIINVDGGAYWSLTGSTTLAALTWYHLAFVLDGDFARLYVDGTQEDSVDISSFRTVHNSTELVGIGSAGGFVGLNFVGHIDEYAISDNARYPDGTPFTPPVTELSPYL